MEQMVLQEQQERQNENRGKMEMHLQKGRFNHPCSHGSFKEDLQTGLEGMPDEWLANNN